MAARNTPLTVAQSIAFNRGMAAADAARAESDAAALLLEGLDPAFAGCTGVAGNVNMDSSAHRNEWAGTTTANTGTWGETMRIERILSAQ